MTTLVTNDDGLTDGLKILTEAALKLDKDAYAITTSQQKSAVAKGITMHKILRLRKVESQSLPIYTLSGTPADCIAFAIRSGELKKPDSVLSGINIGDNLSYHSIYSSGTIGACIEAVFHNIPAVAFSFELHGDEARRCTYAEWPKREALREKIAEITRRLSGKIPPGVLVNVNIPYDFENAEFSFPKPAVFQYISTIEKRLDPHGQPYYWHYGERDENYEKGSDVYDFVVNRSIILTPISIFGIVDRKALDSLRTQF